MSHTAPALFPLMLPVVAALGSSQTPPVLSCLRADGDAYAVRFRRVRLLNVIYGQEMTMTFTMTTEEELRDQPTLTIDMLKPYDYDMSCKNNFGSCEYLMCGPLNKEEFKNVMNFMHSECPIEPGSYTLTIKATIPNVSYFRQRFKTCRCDEKGDEPACSTEAAEHNAAQLRRREQLRNKTLPVLITMQNNGEPVGCNTFYITVSE
ncbi:uncharacterized protein LOC142786704 isoform X2 [Rhipicephalus microplus]|uniref:uncharacterized protein LOC142786704 isoform X2 n=1 Tax=Rhipicephalus microplus TaxID=6941 RepID=UPI003F6CBBDB